MRTLDVISPRRTRSRRRLVKITVVFASDRFVPGRWGFAALAAEGLRERSRQKPGRGEPRLPGGRRQQLELAFPGVPGFAVLGDPAAVIGELDDGIRFGQGIRQ